MNGGKVAVGEDVEVVGGGVVEGGGVVKHID